MISSQKLRTAVHLGSVHLHYHSVNFTNLRPDIFVANMDKFWAKFILTYSSIKIYPLIPTIYPFSTLKFVIVIPENCRWTDSNTKRAQSSEFGEF